MIPHGSRYTSIVGAQSLSKKVSSFCQWCERVKHQTEDLHSKQVTLTITIHVSATMGATASAMHSLFGSNDSGKIDRDSFIWSYTIGSGSFSKVCSVNHIGND